MSKTGGTMYLNNSYLMMFRLSLIKNLLIYFQQTLYFAMIFQYKFTTKNYEYFIFNNPCVSFKTILYNCSSHLSLFHFLFSSNYKL